jgi:hypothetical protein
MITWAQLWLSNREMRIEELGVELMAKQGAVLPKQRHQILAAVLVPLPARLLTLRT